MADTTRSEPAPELIARARGGDESAFAELLAPYRVPLFSLLLRDLRNRADAEDTMQDVLFLTWRGLPRYEHRERFGAWLFTIAYRSLSTRRRRGRLELAPAADALPRAEAPVTPWGELEAVELQQTITRALDELPDQQRRVFLLRQSSAMSFAEIARLLGEPLNTVLSHMNYAVTKLRRATRPDDA